ncbi:hypothetical protein [Sigmofec virus UA08Rod_5342]|uniref:Uncharacterized protein n=1 Tax=Sigmofec virus UA08Rod_5342 TaxID=2929420 RepID=A0A976N175_9VIRU|nr:hypothetical protein [Sigmofec virus UA08Rod_5342]
MKRYRAIARFAPMNHYLNRVVNYRGGRRL